ncbi:MAG TPA: transcriptional repressor [Actinomycetota bacterium]|nr:transcriptional repressor [Actinomycetota bacterium]
MTRSTKQRAEILRALEDADNFTTAQELHESLRASGSSVGLTTVYRNLQALAAGGSIDSLVTSRGEAIYRKCTTSGHHHHLVCTRCKRSVEIEAGPIEEWVDSVARRHRFSDVSHVAELFGLCDTCAS